MKHCLAALLISLASTGAGWAAETPADDGSEHEYRPAYASCAAYFFLAARGHDAKHYDALYSAGEFSLNQAIIAHGRATAETRMENDSAVMMREIDQDWRLIERLDHKYGGACEALMRDAHFEAK